MRAVELRPRNKCLPITCLPLYRFDIVAGRRKGSVALRECKLMTKYMPALPKELLTEDSFLDYIGVNRQELLKIWWFRERMYKNFIIPKSSGKDRYIFAPDDRLKYIQRKLVPMLELMYQPRNSVHGFVRSRSVRSNAAAHLRSRYIINIDLMDFFLSISERRVVGLLKALSISEQVSEILARLVCHHGRLPQGAPTSPIISNMICYKMDIELFNRAKTLGAIYTRYADDITFSSFRKMDKFFEVSTPTSGSFEVEALDSSIRKIIQKNGFQLNASKLYYSDFSARRVVTGIKINQNLNVDRKYIRKTRAMLFSVEKDGYDKSLSKYQSIYCTKNPLKNHLRGRVSWISFVKGSSDPTVRRLIIKFNELFQDSKIQLQPTLSEKIERAIWIVEHDGDNGTQGTCFFLKNAGLITAEHCVSDPINLVVYHPSKPSNKFTVKIDRKDTVRDIAVLEHDIANTEFFELDISDLPETEILTVIAAGYPDFGPGDKLNRRLGTINSVNSKNSIRYFETSQIIAPGMSGGPLLDINNNVCGVNHKGGPAETRNLAIHISELKLFLGFR